jgi:hypothetical protein
VSSNASSINDNAIPNDENLLLPASEIIGIPYAISENECFLRTIKRPMHYKPGTQDLKQSTLFMPWAEVVNGVLKMEGVSLDRLSYCTTQESKEIAIANFGSNEDGSLVYDGLACVPFSAIRDINSLPLEKISPSFKRNNKFQSDYTSALPKLAVLLSGFDISSLHSTDYCGVIATPMTNDDERIAPNYTIKKNSLGNIAHAEIFYLHHLVNPTPQEPFGGFIIEMAKHLTKASTIKFDRSEASHPAPTF